MQIKTGFRKAKELLNGVASKTRMGQDWAVGLMAQSCPPLALMEHKLREHVPSQKSCKALCDNLCWHKWGLGLGHQSGLKERP